MKLKEIYRSSDYYSICTSDRAEGLVLYVVAGGIGIHAVVMELLPKEVEEFERKGHLDRLARDVSGNEEKYLSRFLHPISEGETLEFVDDIQPS